MRLSAIRTRSATTSRRQLHLTSRAVSILVELFPAALASPGSMVQISASVNLPPVKALRIAISTQRRPLT